MEQPRPPHLASDAAEDSVVHALADNDRRECDESSEPPAPRRWWGRPIGELRWQAELARLTADPVFYGIGVPHGQGQPVLLIPGFLVGDVSLAVLSNWLRRIGYRTHDAQILLNADCSNRAVSRLTTRLEWIAEHRGQRVAIVGHSRGGEFAKTLAQRRPDVVAGVVTLGAGLDTPFAVSLPAKAAVAAVRRTLHLADRASAKRGCFTASCDCAYTHGYREPFPAQVPLTSVYSEGDGVVWWKACVVPYARNVEVGGSHLGLAYNRKAYRAIARALRDMYATGNDAKREHVRRIPSPRAPAVASRSRRAAR